MRSSWRSRQFVTVASTVDATANVAELSATLAGHVVTAFALFDPELAVVALLELHALRKLEELGVIFARLGVDLVFLTRHAIVEDRLAIQAVMLVTLRAFECVYTTFVFLENKCKLAIRRWAP